MTPRKSGNFKSFQKFYREAKAAASLARSALDETNKVKSINLWQKLFGTEKFPGPEPDDEDDDNDNSNSGGNSGGFTPRTKSSVPGKGRFAST